jgi:hypothetical protein
MARRHDESPESSGARKFWIAAAVAVAAVLFWAATNNAVYEVTSPGWFSWHVVLRKSYSIAAFALVGFIWDKALGPTARAGPRAALAVAAYSAAIEIAQAVRGSQEGIAWNAADVLCGAAGGWLGVVAGRIRRSRRRA